MRILLLNPDKWPDLAPALRKAGHEVLTWHSEQGLPELRTVAVVVLCLPLHQGSAALVAGVVAGQRIAAASICKLAVLSTLPLTAPLLKQTADLVATDIEGLVALLGPGDDQVAQETFAAIRASLDAAAADPGRKPRKERRATDAV